MKDLIDQLGRELLLEAIDTNRAGGEGSLTSKDRVDIFKATSLWHLGLNRKPTTPEEPDGKGGETFDKIAKRINGKGAVHQ